MNRIRLFFWMLMVGTGVISQELDKLTPLSPNVASISKYGEVPVGHFTGVPKINIPIYSIEDGVLNLPISLNYHAGGNKVESIASWVGLGWSLGSVPSISRSVRGIPDEEPGGYFSKYKGHTLSEFSETRTTKAYHVFKNDLIDGHVDTEPDIFFYILNNESGKFFYNQETESFFTISNSKINIIKTKNGFKIITQKGIAYHFDREETSILNSLKPVTTTWYVSKIEHPTNEKTIRFTYTKENQILKFRSAETKYHYLSGRPTNTNFPKQSITSIQVTNAITPDSIIFPKGFIKFNKSLNNREDLKGGKELNSISIYNNQNNLLKKYSFHYYYKSGSGNGILCYNVDSYSKKWMFLEKITQSGTNTNNENEYRFTYKDAEMPPCRMSAAQDYWGYYNGQDNNKSIIPSYYIPNTTYKIIGAIRQVNPNKSDFGVLSKIKYPTGGYAEFIFENNLVNSTDIDPQFKEKKEMLSADEFLEADEELPVFNSFEKQFSINNPPNLVLNNNNPKGGSTTKFKIINPGCALDGKSNPCALFTVINIETNKTYYINLKETYFYLPNGTYKLKAEFNQNIPKYENFIFIVTWDVLKGTDLINRWSGGLRIKEIKTFENDKSKPLIKNYLYVNSLDSEISSGDVFGIPKFKYTEPITLYSRIPSGIPNAYYIIRTEYLRVRSKPNFQQITHSGSYTGYKKVFEITRGSVKNTGHSSYTFSHKKDVVFTNFPYPPSQSKELERGQLLNLETKRFGDTENNSGMVRQKIYTYERLKQLFSFGIKWGTRTVSGSSSVPINEKIKNLILVPYYIEGGSSVISQETDVMHGNANSVSSVKNYKFDMNTLLINKISTTTSNGKTITKKLYYPDDITSTTSLPGGTLSSSEFNAIKLLKTPTDANPNGQHRIGEVIQEVTEISGSDRTFSRRNNYANWNGKILPISVQTSKNTQPLEDRVVYHRYDSHANPLEISLKDGPHTVYLYGYTHQYPIAKIENATFSEVARALGVSEAALEDFNENQIGQINGLRAKKPEWMITTYTHIPLVGVKTITDPKGLTTTYEYDDFNRLQYIRDHNWDILEAYEYNYRTE